MIGFLADDVVADLSASLIDSLIGRNLDRIISNAINDDTRGRMSGLDKVDASGNVLANYVTSVGYNTAGQMTSFNLVNGVNETYGYSADLQSKALECYVTLWNSLDLQKITVQHIAVEVNNISLRWSLAGH